jgi:hypothetical protein
VGRDGVHPALDTFGAAGPAARQRSGHRRGRLPRDRAVGGRFRALGLRDGADGRRAAHPQPLPGARGRDPHRAGLAGPGPGPGRAGRRSGRPGRGHRGQHQAPPAAAAIGRGGPG